MKYPKDRYAFVDGGVNVSHCPHTFDCNQIQLAVNGGILKYKVYWKLRRWP